MSATIPPLTPEDLSQILSATGKSPITVTNMSIQPTQAGFGVNSSIARIANIKPENGLTLPFTLFVKQYKPGPRSKTNFERELAFLSFGNQYLSCGLGGDISMRATPLCFNAQMPQTSPIYRQLNRDMQLILYGHPSQSTLRQEIPQRVRDGENICIDDVVSLLEPMALLRVKATAYSDELAHLIPKPLGGIPTQDSTAYAKKYVQYVNSCVGNRLSYKEKGSLLKAAKVLAPYIAADKEQKDLSSIVHGDLGPVNMFGAPHEKAGAIIDPSDFRFASRALDPAYLFENPTFDGLNLNKEVLVKSDIEAMAAMRAHFKLPKEDIPFERELAAHHACGLYYRARICGITQYNLGACPDFREYLARHPEEMDYVLTGMKNSAGNLRALYDLFPEGSRERGAVERIADVLNRYDLLRHPDTPARNGTDQPTTTAKLPAVRT